eukprot:g33.t1
MRNLRQLHLKSTFVSGDLRVFEKTPKLQLLTLFKTHVRGDLAATHVFGDVAALNTTNAYAVRLSYTKVWGRVESLQPLQRLTWVDLTHTQVSGNIKAFQGPDLGRLGEAGPFRRPGLCPLRFYSPSPTGGSYAGHPVLESIQVGSTQVEGDIDSLLFMTDLYELDISSTQVTGRVSLRWGGHFQHLRTMKLHHSQVQFVPDGDWDDGRF